MLAGPDGSIYRAAFEKNQIARFDPKTKRTTTVIEDKRLQWPDTMSWGPNGSLYVTTSQIHRTAQFDQGESKVQEPFRIYRLVLPK